MTPRAGKRPVYLPGRRELSARQREEVCVGAILTQNTNWGNVESALVRLNEARALGLKELRALPLRRLESLIRTSGYFRQKAKKLKLFARHALGRGSLKEWLSGDLRERREELLGLWGVGPETADSVLLYAGERPVFVVDAYTLRIGGRLGWFGQTDYDRAQRFLQGGLPRSVPLYNEFHALLVAHAKRHCRTTPVCAGCPVRRLCRHGSKK